MFRKTLIYLSLDQATRPSPRARKVWPSSLAHKDPRIGLRYPEGAHPRPGRQRVCVIYYDQVIIYFDILVRWTLILEPFLSFNQVALRPRGHAEVLSRQFSFHDFYPYILANCSSLFLSFFDMFKWRRNKNSSTYYEPKTPVLPKLALPDERYAAPISFGPSHSEQLPTSLLLRFTPERRSTTPAYEGHHRSRTLSTPVGAREVKGKCWRHPFRSINLLTFAYQRPGLFGRIHLKDRMFRRKTRWMYTRESLVGQLQVCFCFC